MTPYETDNKITGDPVLVSVKIIYDPVQNFTLDTLDLTKRQICRKQDRFGLDGKVGIPVFLVIKYCRNLHFTKKYAPNFFVKTHTAIQNPNIYVLPVLPVVKYCRNLHFTKKYAPYFFVKTHTAIQNSNIYIFSVIPVIK